MDTSTTNAANVTNIALVAKQPPPEKAEAISLRTKIILSFWAVIVVLGLPTWWQTTTIYRANLPLQEMLNWAEGVNTPTAIPLHVWISAPNYSCSDAQAIVRDTQQALDDLNEYPTLHQRLHLVKGLSGARDDGQNEGGASTSCGEDPFSVGLGDPALKVSLEPTTESFTFNLDEVSATVVVRIPPGPSIGASKHLAGALHEIFRDEQIASALQAVSLASHSQNAQAFLRSQPYDLVTGIERQINRAYKSSPQFHLTFSLFTASGAPSSWDVQEALEDHIQPLVQALSNTAKFEVTTQIQLYSSFSPSIRPATREGQDATFLEQKDLTAFVNAAEWPLAPSIGDGPTLNFIVYVPTQHQIPLLIEGIDGTSWLIPQWGGIQILNPPLYPHPSTGAMTIPAHLGKDLLRQPFETFSSQLLSLLGVRSDGSTQTLPLQLRLDAFQRLSALTLYLKAASSLGSLSRLAQRLSNIPIPRNVAQLVDDTIGNLTASRHAFLESRWDSALAHAKVAFMDSEKAFFDKSMVGQVYFPDEHKVAVYLPLLGPIGVPLLVGLLKEIKRIASTKQAATS
ncbi:uncharacterized protein Z518_10648 [Rhinocladiella mackenziei CBS 650.93]|uniref:GPI transamidase component PIG-S n=1 Tax=Rhinocladiella mackenziei CBS 650.93 TaxID=1442369 RepID=A0A0D2GQG7_9EURO|nr:uncharacterized protein Z518_10648 [Rhinocladiella mackenziei CBS 650.93]KIX00508.1 hypothetical protein Z518_10648 [Rhinocladiella mackenziei CBS 650.93]